MRNVKLADGTVYPVDRCGATDDLLMINVTTADDLLDIVMKFGHPENTTRIEHYFDGTETDHTYFDGYTKLTAAYGTQTGTTVTLRKNAYD